MKPTPPLLMLAEGRRPRPRKTPRNRPREIRLHLDVAALLRRHARPGWIWFHIPNGEKRDLRTAAKLKAMGVLAGAPDFAIIGPDGRFCALELKRAGGELSDAQQAFKAWAIKHGVAYAVAENMQQVLVALHAWNALVEPREAPHGQP